MGGMIVQQFLKTGSCKKAVLMSSVPPAGVLMASLRVLTKFPGAIPHLFQMNLLGVFRKYPQLMFNDPALCAKYAPRMCAESFLAYLGLIPPVSHQTSVPILVVGGSEDGLITVREFASTAKHYQAQLEIIEGGSHDLMLDAEFMKTADLIHQWIIKQ
jgi:pimeloyl-ACP methyl ester carboxylesterase